MTEEPLKPEDRVSGALRNLQNMAKTEDLNANRSLILHMLDRALSWDGELTSGSFRSSDQQATERLSVGQSPTGALPAHKSADR